MPFEEGSPANKGRLVLWLGALVAHGLLRNDKETEISHSPTVSRLFYSRRRCCQGIPAHNWHTELSDNAVVRSDG